MRERKRERVRERDRERERERGEREREIIGLDFNHCLNTHLRTITPFVVFSA